MMTQDLIAQLSQQPAARPMRPGRYGAVLVLAALLPLLGFWGIMGLRPGLLQMLAQPVVALKTALPLFCAGWSLFAVIRFTRPGARLPLWPLILPLLVGIGLIVYGVAPASGSAQWTPFYISECVGLIIVLAALPIVVAVHVFSQGASTRPGASAALSGLAASSLAASGYSLYCTQDNPLFFVIWYGIAIGVSTALSWGIGRSRFSW
ncbi:hypothetical protein BFP70_09850 [Thioclava sp. SK-1]|uniref:NrsF family protein n=1 Tax=Thioclava sp. SK-1 TaxID=1889770 RepID=UPI000825422D|nr:NrsF family protein [Thioclava sp. SK-1]OCX65359.1 hypothetical protein BFP70_09850 [Thioclava sp. SK-1]